MRPVSDTDTMFLVPASVDEIADAYVASPVAGVSYEIERHEDMLTVRDGGMVVVETYLTVLGGCVVRMAPIMGDAHEIASFINDPAEVAAIIAAEQAACHAEDMILQLGAIPACRKGGKWVPAAERHRAAWSARVVAENTRRMRLMGAERRGARVAANGNKAIAKAA